MAHNEWRLSHHDLQTFELPDEQRVKERGASKTGAVLVAGAAALVVGTLFGRNIFGGLLDGVSPMREGEETVEVEVERIDVALREEMLSAPVSIQAKGSFYIDGRGVMGWGANVSCENIPFEGTAHGYVPNQLTGTITGDQADLTIASDWKFPENEINVDMVNPGDGRSANDAYCNEGGLAEVTKFVGGEDTNPQKELQSDIEQSTVDVLDATFPYELDDTENEVLTVLECGLAGRVAREAQIMNPDLDPSKISVTVGSRGAFTEKVCVENGTTEEGQAWSGAGLPYLTLSGDAVNVEVRH